MDDLKMLRKSFRTRYLINPRFQLFMVGFALFQSLFTIGLIYAMNVYFFNRFSAMGVAAGIPKQNIYFDFLKQQQAFFGHAVFLFSILIALMILGAVILVSHRIAGPLHRLCEHMNEIADGKELHPLDFRKRDFFPEVADVFNRLVARLSATESKTPGNLLKSKN